MSRGGHSFHKKDWAITAALAAAAAATAGAALAPAAAGAAGAGAAGAAGAGAAGAGLGAGEAAALGGTGLGGGTASLFGPTATQAAVNSGLLGGSATPFITEAPAALAFGAPEASMLAGSAGMPELLMTAGGADPSILARMQGAFSGTDWAKGAKNFGKAANSMQKLGLLQQQDKTPPPYQQPPQSSAPITNTILYPQQTGGVGAPVGIDQRDPRYLAWLAMQQGRGMA